MFIWICFCQVELFTVICKVLRNSLKFKAYIIKFSCGLLTLVCVTFHIITSFFVAINLYTFLRSTREKTVHVIEPDNLKGTRKLIFVTHFFIVLIDWFWYSCSLFLGWERINVSYYCRQCYFICFSLENYPKTLKLHWLSAFIKILSIATWNNLTI